MPNSPSVWKKFVGGRIELDLYRKLQKAAEASNEHVFTHVVHILKNALKDVHLTPEDWQWISTVRDENDGARRSLRRRQRRAG